MTSSSSSIFSYHAPRNAYVGISRTDLADAASKVRAVSLTWHRGLTQALRQSPLLSYFYFYHTYSSSAESAYIIPIFTRLHRHLKQYKKATQYSFHLIHQQDSDSDINNYYLQASNDMDELNNLIRIEELCRNLRSQQQQEQQRDQQQQSTVTSTG